MLQARTAFAVLCALTAPIPVLAQDSDLSRLREEVKMLQRSYEERMRALEKRLAEAEARASKAQPLSPTTAATAAPAPRRSSDSAFNPAISLIMQGTYARTSRDPNNFVISGFVPSGGEVGPPRRSFGLGETELTFTGNIDPYFRAVAIAALTPENEV